MRIISSKEPPLGKYCTDIAKIYLAYLAENLEESGLDRYFYMLLVLDEHSGNITQQQLSELLNCDKVTTLRNLDHLAKLELVERVINQKDRREHLLQVTGKGKKLIPKIRQTYKELELEAFKGMSEMAIKDFYQTLELIKTNLNTRHSAKLEIKPKVKKIK
jgi:DNA-binding MarR family transcriptional regulator